ncbi:MAG: hypothetical protein BIFFINMI_00938 [Phycisphaerae bacterium]|nr:hypothetical protein [Phycisphaerae bacterium]
MSIQEVHTAVTSDYAQTLIRIKAGQLGRRPEFRGRDVEELQQDLVLRVLQRAHTFNPDRGSVNTFITRVVETAVAKMCRDYGRIKRGARLEMQSLEGSRIPGEDGVDVALGESLLESDQGRRRGEAPVPELDRLQAEMDFTEALGSLSPQASQVARLLKVGTSMRAIASQLGISRRQVRWAIAEIRERLRETDLVD